MGDAGEEDEWKNLHFHPQHQLPEPLGPPNPPSHLDQAGPDPQGGHSSKAGWAKARQKGWWQRSGGWAAATSAGSLGSPLPQNPTLCGPTMTAASAHQAPSYWGRGRGDLDCMAPFPGIISHLAVTLNKMGHNFPGTQTLSAAGAAPGGRGRAGVLPTAKDT